jgi:hypothetical protein
MKVIAKEENKNIIHLGDIVWSTMFVGAIINDEIYISGNKNELHRLEDPTDITYLYEADLGDFEEVVCFEDSEDLNVWIYEKLKKILEARVV